MADTFAAESLITLDHPGPTEVQAAIDAAIDGQTTRLMKDGESMAVIVPPGVFDELLDASVARRELAEALAVGSADIRAGRIVPGDAVTAKLRRWANQRA